MQRPQRPQQTKEWGHRHLRNAVGLESAAELAAYAKKRERDAACCSLLRHRKVLLAAVLLLVIPCFFIFRFDKVIEERVRQQVLAEALKIFDRSDVHDAGTPSMVLRDSNGLVRPGEGTTASYRDGRGLIQKTSLGGLDVNLMHTKAGFMRSGDLHNCTQVDFILKGVVTLIIPNKDVPGANHEYTHRALAVIRVPKFTPHILRFDKDTVMAEWWECPFHAYYFAPYRSRVEAYNKQRLAVLAKAKAKALVGKMPDRVRRLRHNK